MRMLLGTAITLALAQAAYAHTASIDSPSAATINASFDIVKTQISRQNGELIFRQEVRDQVGHITPTAKGKLAGSDVFSYVWPTNLDTSTIGFDREQGILAFVLTAHPDFDDTPLYDENGDGKNNNDGNLWHSHWVVLAKDKQCAGGLKVKDIPAGTQPKLPKTWPGLALLIDSPGYEPKLVGKTVEVHIPETSSVFPDEFNFDGVTAALKVNADLHQPLLCVNEVHDVASGNLSLPAKIARSAKSSVAAN